MHPAPGWSNAVGWPSSAAVGEDSLSLSLLKSRPLKVVDVTPEDDLPKLLSEAADGDVFDLADGTYKYDAGSNGMLEIRTAVAVRAKNRGRAVLHGRGEMRVLYVNAGGGRVVLYGLNITRGYTQTGPGTGSLFSGGGVYIVSGDVTFAWCSIYSNQANFVKGGGVAIAGGDISFTSCNIYSNVAAGYGGGVYVTYSGSSLSTQVQFQNCEIYQNNADAGSNGGGLYIDSGTATAVNCSLYDNRADAQGGAIYVRSNAALLAHNLTIRNNTALATGENLAGAGGGLYNLGNVTLFGGIVHDNHAPNAPGANIFNGASFAYVLPAPLGFYLDGVFTCGLAKCPKPGSTTLVPCAQQSCDDALLHDQPVARLQQGPIEDPLPTACPPGFHAASADRDSQTTALCSGACPEGSTCPNASTTEPVPAPPGFYAPKGSTAPIACGGQSFYCPGGSSAPRQVDAGHETFTDTTLPNAHALDAGDPSTRTSQQNCSLAWCSGGQAFNCTAGSFANLSVPFALRTNERAACVSCQPNSTTFADGGTDPSDCICIAGFYADLTHDARNCAPCPYGFDCSGVMGLSTTTLLVRPGYWRPSASATTAKRCPIDGTCAGGATALNFSLADASSCHEGFKGPFCTDCVEPSRYILASRDEATRCAECSNALLFFGYAAAVVLALVAAILGGFVLLASCRRGGTASSSAELRASVQQEQQPALEGAPVEEVEERAVCTALRAGHSELTAAGRWLAERPCVVRLRDAAVETALPTKLKICLGVSLITAQMPSVYRLRYPPDYQSLSSTVFAPLVGDLFAWIPGLHLECLGFGRLWQQLALYTLLPVALLLLWFAVTRLWRGSLIPALPNALRFTYTVFPIVSSKGFQALAACDCFKSVDSSELCLLPSDWHVVCPKDGGLLALAWVAVLLYGLGVPLAYAVLLVRCREAIQTGAPSALSEALEFLHKELRPATLWWPLVEAARALLLTGFFALLSPGSITQLLFGLIAAFAFFAIQLWCMPYVNPGDRFIAMVGGAGLILSFISSLGVQFNAITGTDYVNNTLLAVGLFVSAFAVFAITFLAFLAPRS